jgi:diphosphomevalonate decarboxylase
MTEKEFITKPYSRTIDSGRFKWSAPSNIALVKYWGKEELQIPKNPSISFTLDACKTETSLDFKKLSKPSQTFSFEVYFEGKVNLDFRPKIETFFNRIELYLPFLKDYHLSIHTSNSFPHSSGIASSASGMSALALCLMSLEKALIGEMSDYFFKRKASFLARLGSGSACRSIEGDLIIWGKHNEIDGSSDLFGIKLPQNTHENFKNYHDTILLVDKGEKQVSSTIGHDLMRDHPFASQRFDQAYSNSLKLSDILQSGDLNAFIKVLEQEALTLHAMMMTSDPGFILMKPNTLKIINKIWQFRARTKLHLGFTLDAGANVHILYPEAEAKQIFEFIRTELVAYCQNGHYICDRIGFGAKQLPI